MSKRTTLLLIPSLLLLAAVATNSPRDAFAGEQCEHSAPMAAKLFDGIIVRPIGVVLSTATSALYFGTSPLTFLMNVDEPAADVMVSEPWRMTAGRPLGKF